MVVCFFIYNFLIDTVASYQLYSCTPPLKRGFKRLIACNTNRGKSMKTHQIRHSATGETLFEGVFKTIRETVERAVGENTRLDHADLSGANLVNAALDGARMCHACFNGANLMGANLSEATLDGADFTAASLQAVCLRFSTLRGCNFDGAAFGATDIYGCDIGGSHFSTPAAFLLNFADAINMKDCYYSISGHEACLMSRPPVFIQGLREPVVLMDDCMLIGSVLHPRAGVSSGTNDNRPAAKLDINSERLYK